MVVVDENRDSTHARAERGDAIGWREVHAQLLSLRKRRARLDHEELVALRAAVRLQVWREVGAASMREYLERVLGHGPRAANERLRVAGVLDAMPALDAALASGELPYSAVREISRIATSGTEEDWIDACRGKNLRQIEELVSQRAPGDAPDSPRRPELQKFIVRLELNAAQYALWRQARQLFQEECDDKVEDSQVLAVMCAQMIEAAPDAPQSKGGPSDAGTSDAGTSDAGTSGARPSDAGLSAEGRCRDECSRERVSASSAKATERRRGRAKYQIAVTICSLCKQGWQHAGGRLIAIEPPDVARALCDAQRIGSLVDAEGHAVQVVPRLTQDIPPKTRRFVLMRDGHRCTVPGCRSSRFIEVHHLEPRAFGGDHSPANLTCLCGGHHDALHRGTLIITGSAPDLKFEFRNAARRAEEDRAHVDSMPAIRPTVGSPHMTSSPMQSVAHTDAIRT